MSPGEPRQQGAEPAGRRSWGDLGPRVASALVLIAITAVSLYFGGYVFASVVGAVFAGCYREWDRMVTLRPLTPIGGVLIALVALSGLLFPLLGAGGSAGLIGIACLASLAEDRAAAPWRIGGLVFFGAVIIAVLGMRGTTDAGIQAGVFLGTVVWMTDTGAYFTGRQVGGERLAPDISPSKTWSGALGGLTLAVIAGTILWMFLTTAPFWIGTLLAAGLSVLGQLGDLTESAIKRRFRVKDSGDIIPGHGGLMDRLDSLTFAVLMLFVIGLARGGPDAVASGFLHW